MYTLIIQSRSAKESYDQFYPLLANTLKGGDVKICDWNEDGTNIETAVPELMSAVERKKKWRAVVVQLDLENEQTSNQSVDGNPYHFVHYQALSFHERLRDTVIHKQKDVAPSDIPLVRITQLLAGIPVPAPDFYMDWDKESDGNIKKYSEEEGENESACLNHQIFFEENELETTALKKKVSAWNETYLSHFSPPVEILLVRVRKASVGVRDYEIETKWGAYWETDSSSFRQKNGYALGCRFLVFDVDAHGELSRRSDLFRLWLCVQLLAENRISPSVLQADRLYRIDVKLNELRLASNVQKTANQLSYAQFEIENLLQKTKHVEMPKDKSNVNPKQEVAVNLSPAETAGFSINQELFDLAADSLEKDHKTWSNYTECAHKEWNTVIRSISRALDQSASVMRVRCRLNEKEVYPLTEYEEEDLQDQLDEYYSNILEGQEKLPASDFMIKEELAKQEKEVQKSINRRLDKKRVNRVRFWIMFFVEVSMAYGFFNSGAPFYLGTVTICAAALILLIIWAILKVRFRKFIRTMKAYEKIYYRTLSDIRNSESLFSLFFSHITSHIRGKNYLFILKQQKKHQLDTLEDIERQLKRVEWFQETLQHWCEALQLNIDMDNKNAVQIMANNRHRLHEEDLYRLEISFPRAVEVSSTGTYVSTSYEFIDRLEIEREEVFDRV